MSKATKFVYVPLNKNLEFQQLMSQSDTIVPYSLYVDREEQKIYLVEEPTGAIMDSAIQSIDFSEGL